MNWWVRLFNKKRLEAELRKELDFHLEQQAADYQRSGVPPAESSREARIQFGGSEQVREACRDARGTRWLEATWQDVRLAARKLRKSPGFAVAAIASLALGIGANTAIFTLLDAARLRSLPVPNPQQLALIQIEGGNQGFGISGDSRELSYAVWQQIHEQQRGFAGVFAWAQNSSTLDSASGQRSLKGLWMSGGTFSTLGLVPARGRFFAGQDDRPGCGIPGMIISYGFWQSEFGGRDSAIGSKLTIRDHPTEVLGVAPRGFTGLAKGDNFDIALPLCSLTAYSPGSDVLQRTDYQFLTVMGRLRNSWNLAQASAQLASISPAVFRSTLPGGYDQSAHRFYTKFRLSALPASQGIGLMSESNQTLELLLGLTGLVLLIACANLANLMLVRAAANEREMAVRLALGAGRARLIRQVLTESVLLALLGTAGGLLLARELSRGIIVLLTTQNDSPYLDLNLDWRILAFTAGLAVLACILFGLIPAWCGSLTQPGDAIKAGGRSMSGSRRSGLFQNTLIVAQTAISLVLLVGALLFVQSFWKLMTLNPGFREKNIVIASLDFSRLHLPPGAPSRAFERDLLAQIRALPRVESAASSTHQPLDGSSWSLGFDLGATEGSSKFTWASPGYFGTMGMSLLAGRDFGETDTATAPHVAVVNQTFVRQFLRGVDPIGRTLLTSAEPGYPATEYQIIGVVHNAKYASLREPIPPEVFGPAQQFPAGGQQMNIFVRSSAPAGETIMAVKKKLEQISPGIRGDFTVFATQIEDGLVTERLMAVLSACFGVLAALLAGVGLYGVLSYAVAMRRNEIGIRLALGASGNRIMGGILRWALVLLLIGMTLGLVFAALAASAARSLLFGLQPTDPITYFAASAFLFAIALLASFLPACRAARLDPMTALRHE